MTNFENTKRAIATIKETVSNDMEGFVRSTTTKQRAEIRADLWRCVDDLLSVMVENDSLQEKHKER